MNCWIWYQCCCSCRNTANCKVKTYLGMLLGFVFLKYLWIIFSQNWFREIYIWWSKPSLPVHVPLNQLSMDFESMVNGRKDFISFLHRRVQGLRTTCRLSRCSFFMITGVPTFLQKLWVQTFLDIVLAGSLGTLQRTKFSAALAEKQFIHPPEKIN